MIDNLTGNTYGRDNFKGSHWNTYGGMRYGDQSRSPASERIFVDEMLGQGQDNQRELLIDVTSSNNLDTM